MNKSLLVFLLMFVFVGNSYGDPLASGIRISETSNTGLDVGIDVTAFYSTSSSASSAGLGFIGAYYDTIGSTYVTTTVLPAVDWGDSNSTITYTDIPLIATTTTIDGPGIGGTGTGGGVPVRAYRSAFIHTYDGPGNYHITSAICCSGFIGRDGGSTVYDSSTNILTGFPYYFTFYGEGGGFSGSYTVVQNFLDIVVEQVVNTPIPTMPPIVLLLIAGMLGFAGFRALRKQQA